MEETSVTLFFSYTNLILGSLITKTQYLKKQHRSLLLYTAQLARYYLEQLFKEVTLQKIIDLNSPSCSALRGSLAHVRPSRASHTWKRYSSVLGSMRIQATVIKTNSNIILMSAFSFPKILNFSGRLRADSSTLE